MSCAITMLFHNFVDKKSRYLLSGLILLHDLSERRASGVQKVANERKGFQFLREGISKISGKVLA